MSKATVFAGSAFLLVLFLAWFAFEKPADAQNVSTIVVGGRSGWVDSGVTIRAGWMYEISASGTWGENRGLQRGPNGANEVMNPNVPYPHIRVAALVARVGNGTPFFVGERATVNTNGSGTGTLFFMMNDGARHDNHGQLRVEVRARR